MFFLPLLIYGQVLLETDIVMENFLQEVFWENVLVRILQRALAPMIMEAERCQNLPPARDRRKAGRVVLRTRGLMVYGPGQGRKRLTFQLKQ